MSWNWKHWDWQQEQQQFWAALMFYTRIPVPNSYQYSEENFHRSRKYLICIGFLVACIAILTVLITQLFLPMSLSIALSMLATILVTGAFHEDGFADSCDGFGGGWKKEHVLTIMKDSRVGTYATVGMISILGIKFLALYEIARHSSNLLYLALINGHTLSRMASSLTIEKLNYVQNSDVSKIKSVTAIALTLPERFYSYIFCLPAFLLLLFSQPAAILTLIPLIATFVSLCRYFQKRIGGYTGDCLGAMQQIMEVIFYISLLAFINITLVD